MGEAQERWEQIRSSMLDNGKSPEEVQDIALGMTKAMYDLANDLTYPMDEDGNQMRVHELIPFLAYHLARCGYRKIQDQAVIKQIVHPRRGRPGIVDDAVLYVPVDSPGVIPSVFVPDPEEPVEEAQWHTKTHITLNGDTIKGGN